MYHIYHMATYGKQWYNMVIVPGPLREVPNGATHWCQMVPPIWHHRMRIRGAFTIFYLLENRFALPYYHIYHMVPYTIFTRYHTGQAWAHREWELTQPVDQELLDGVDKMYVICLS